MTAPTLHAPAPAGPPPTPVAVVTGLSGAGNSTAIRALEDMGHEAIDNLPLPFLERLFPVPVPAPAAPLDADAPPAAAPRPVALGLDVRTRGFSPEALMAALASLRARDDLRPRMLFLDCADETLIDRFKATRRRHPLAPDAGVEAGVARERALLQPVREAADLVIDTTDLTPHDLKARLAADLAPLLTAASPRARSMAVSVLSFSYKRGAPREADTVLDVRFLRNPHWEPALRPGTGRDPEVSAHVRGDPLYAEFMDRVAAMTITLLPAYRREGKAYYAVAFGCSGGRHRSVCAAEDLAARLREAGWPAAVRHRELDG